MVIDTHVHAWGPPSRQHPWTNAYLVGNLDSYTVDVVYDVDALLADMDRVGIDEAVVVGFPLCEWTDNWYTVEAASHPRLRGIVLVDPLAAGAADRLRDVLRNDGVVGFRLGAMCPADAMWTAFDESADWLRRAIDQTAFWDTAREQDALVEVLAHESQLDQVLALLERYPDLTVVIDHFANTSPESPPAEGAFGAFRELAAYNGVVPKVSGIQLRSEEGFPYSDMHGHVTWLLDVFGRDRVVWGSDFPNVSRVSTYEESLEWLGHVDTLTTQDQKWLTERTAREYFDD